MKKSTAALASLITAAGLTGGAAATAQAHPAQAQTAAPHASNVALTRLHQVLQTPSTEVGRGIIRPNGLGSPGH